MDALRTQLDSLQWEVNRLDAENRRLREADEQATRLVNLQTVLEQSKNEAATLQERLRATEEHKSTLFAHTNKTDGDQGSTSTVSLEQLEAKDEVIDKLCEELKELIYYSAGQCPVSSQTIDICGVKTVSYICMNNDNNLVWRSLAFSSNYAVIAGFFATSLVIKCYYSNCHKFIISSLKFNAH